ncbi:WhiB family transcriptional regulator [Rhodococcus jostii]|uniref:Transcriptional regulator WhiB n=1 Tax=Rhodococcus jostii TaxID=132919 RepID=A0A1H4ITP6_RHOJO|nr:WhiB family transcriptional regulator [Rhodococcus jostii]SEB37387.1 WhiB family transcriptional regulator, redox-sensing transcriptional regulator [Rhodococcus jostii]
MPQPTQLSRQPTKLTAATDFWDWQLHARCRSTGSATFFAPEGEPAGQRIRREHDAKKICLDCEVRLQCLAHALDTPDQHGVWGGVTERERAQERRIPADSGPS